MTAFTGEAPKEIYDQLETMLKEKDKNLVSALKTIAVCDFSEREIYNDYTENCTNKEKMDKWDDAHRTSMNQFYHYAQRLARKLQEEV